MVLHTATSGAVPGLDELRLVVMEGDQVAALGASRVNIAYLSGIPTERLVAECVAVAAARDWSQPVPDGVSPPCRMLFEMAAMDGAARAASVPLAVYLGGMTPAVLPTNQTLFRCNDDTLLRRARAYVARGFRDLKLRVAFGPFADDLRRMRLLRDALGPDVELSLDANGGWGTAAAAANLAALAPLRLRYAEQPCAPGVALPDAAMPIMLDETLSDLAAVEALAASRARVLAHVKLAKLGGLDRLMVAGRALRAAGIGFMVGQMNEGTVSTLAAAHAAAALGAEMNELYGADGLANDPAGTLRYADGCVHLPPGPGIGLMRHNLDGEVLWEGWA